MQTSNHDIIQSIDFHKVQLHFVGGVSYRSLFILIVIVEVAVFIVIIWKIN